MKPLTTTRSDERTGQAVRAVVVRAPGAAEIDADAVRAHCRGRLARFKVPAQVVFVDELPRTPAGAGATPAPRTAGPNVTQVGRCRGHAGAVAPSGGPSHTLPHRHTC